MATIWQKSSLSTKGSNQCVEIARVADGVLMRDSTNPDGARLGGFAHDQWHAFVDAARADEFRR